MSNRRPSAQHGVMTEVTKAHVKRAALPSIVLVGVAAQFADNAAVALIPGAGLVPDPVYLVVAILLTALGGRLLSRGMAGSDAARVGLAVGAVSGGLGLLFGSWGVLGLVIAGLTVLAGVAGAVARRPAPGVPPGFNPPS